MLESELGEGLGDEESTTMLELGVEED